MFFLLPECINSFILNFEDIIILEKNSCFDKILTIFIRSKNSNYKKPTGFCISKQIYLFLLSVMGRLRLSLVQKLHILMLYAIALSVMVSFCANVYFMFI